MTVWSKFFRIAAACVFAVVAAPRAAALETALTPADMADNADRPGISFVSDREGLWRIYTALPDGTGMRRMTPSVSSIFHSPDYPVWSPDGEKVYFVDGGRIYYAPFDCSKRIEVTKDSDYSSIALSVDGRKLAAASTRDVTSRFLWIFPVRRKEIYSLDSQGSNLRRLTYNKADDWDPDWSPDGSRIAFASRRDGNSEIYVMNADGLSQICLTNNKFDDEHPSWSPDGRYIVFSSKRDGRWKIYKMRADGTEETCLMSRPDDCVSPDWSPDGTQILFQVKSGHRGTLCVMDADGENMKTLTDGRADDKEPSWVRTLSGPDRSIPVLNIYGYITDSDAVWSSSIQDVAIEVVGGRTTAYTDFLGRWSIDNLSEPVTVIPIKDGWTFSPPQRHIVPGLNIERVLVSFSGTRYFNIRGSVRDSSGKGVSGVLLSASSGSASVTGTDGRFSISGLHGRVKLVPSKDGWKFTPSQRALTWADTHCDFSAAQLEWKVQ